jgi:hypothetical protein
MTRTPLTLSIDTELDGLGQTLAKLLPMGAVPTFLRMTATQLRIEGKVPVAMLKKSIALTARVEHPPGALRLHSFAVEGALGFGGKVIDELHQALAKVDERWGPFRAKGDAGGEALVVTWT